MELGELWSLWVSSNVSPNTPLWGVSLLWWGRIGKIIQFVGAALIIAEIIGAERLRSFGSSLHGKFSLATAKLWWHDLQQFIHIHIYSLLLPWFWGTISPIARLFKLKEPANLRDFNLIEFSGEEHPMSFWLYIIYCYGLTALLMYWFWEDLSASRWKTFLQGFLIFMLNFAIIGPIFTIIVIASFTILGLALDMLVIEPFAWVLDRPALDRLVKFVSLLLLIVGFHFDLLAS